MSPATRGRRPTLALLLAVALTLLAAPAAPGKQFDTSPRPTLVLPLSGQFLAQDAMNGVALYRLTDRGLVHRFRAGGEVRMFVVTSDEKILLIGCWNGSLSARDLTTGL